jgi:hypothetical protein
MIYIYVTYFIAMQFDAFQQGIRHSGLWIDKRWDFIWHFAYWFATIPCFCIYGHFLIYYLMGNWDWIWDFWHYRITHFWFVGHIIAGVIGWQLSYRLIWRKKMDRWKEDYRFNQRMMNIGNRWN